MISFGLWCCEVKNITGDDFQSERSNLFNSRDSGVRIAYNGIKAANTQFGLGAVNSAMEAYEKNLCRNLPKGTQVYKTDFKGYFFKCNSNCEEMNSIIKTIESPVLPDNKMRLSTTSVSSGSFKEGYVKARAVSEYGEVGDNFINFVNDEIRASLDDLGDKIHKKSFKSELAKDIELYRKSKLDDIDPKMLRLIKSMDVLVEVPYSNSNNIDDELKRALNSNTKVSSAQTGDDLFIVVKDGKDVSKVIGADAKGLGVLNITSRFDNILERHKNNKNIDDIDALYELSLNSIKDADETMEKSMQLYEKLIREEVLNYPDRELEVSIGMAHKRYNHLALEDVNLMEMRAGALSNCGKDPQEIMNKITAIHNRLKVLESNGIKGYFGRSCLGAEYWILKHGL